MYMMANIRVNQPSSQEERIAKREDSVIFLRGIDADIKARFKAWCARRDRTMTEMFNEFMKKTVSNKK
jgi:hypothetical protein